MPEYLVWPSMYLTDVYLLQQQIKIIDFGESFLHNDVPETLHTPAVVRAPEVIFGDKLDYRVDLWNMGCMISIYELVVGQPPFDAMSATPVRVARQMLENNSDELPERWQQKWRTMDSEWTVRKVENKFQKWLEECYFDGYRKEDLTREDIVKVGVLALALLPGLCLDTLVVEDCWHGFGMGDGWRDVVTYFDIEALLRSNAWKHLTYITPCTDFIASGYDHRRKRSAQPETWDALLKERDGEEGGAEVQMYIVPDKQEGVTGNEKTEDGRIMQPWQAKPGHEVNENWRIAGPDQELKGEVRIVARRGKKATAVQLGLGEQRSWAEIKGKAAGGFAPEGWNPYHNDMADAVGWLYGGYGNRMQLANAALHS
ncbi:Pkinase domain containing protein [Pyrenophora tritici-repentis]|nr:Pkinase domain containing protein [Pyrenophora tritici-repentis]